MISMEQLLYNNYRNNIVAADGLVLYNTRASAATILTNSQLHFLDILIFQGFADVMHFLRTVQL